LPPRHRIGREEQLRGRVIGTALEFFQLHCHAFPVH
jgi:hypothetical protein